ncbi:MAG TPA: hypothetical protein VJT72_24375 [Pseudonocardiaceae bacterium]|nr:hypothetical protein [Pseudonocardiaceae bacterium]
MTTTAMDLLDCLHAHLADFELPDLCSVHASIHEPHITAQLRAQDPSQLAAGLLAWADTLTQPTAEAWRVPNGHSIHLSITGRLPGGVSVHVYGAMPFTARGPGGNLAPSATAPVLLTTLRHLTTPGQVTL